MTLADIGGHWLTLVVADIGGHWLTLADIGGHWLTLADIGGQWQPMAGVGGKRSARSGDKVYIAPVVVVGNTSCFTRKTTSPCSHLNPEPW